MISGMKQPVFHVPLPPSAAIDEREQERASEPPASGRKTHTLVLSERPVCCRDPGEREWLGLLH